MNKLNFDCDKDTISHLSLLKLKIEFDLVQKNIKNLIFKNRKEVFNYF